MAEGGACREKPRPSHHVGGGIGSVTACAGAEPWLRAGAGAGRGAHCCGLGEREAGQAAGGAARNPIDRLTLRLTGGRRRRESEAAPGDAENQRFRFRGRRSVGVLNEAPAPLSPEPGAFPARWTVSPAASVSPAAGSRPSCVTRDPGFLRARRRPCSPAAPAGGRLSRHMVPARLQPRRRLRDGRPLPPCSPRLQTLLSSQSPLQCGGPPSPQRPSSHCCVPPGTLNTFLRRPLKTGHPFIKYSSLPQSTSLF